MKSKKHKTVDISHWYTEKGNKLLAPGMAMVSEVMKKVKARYPSLTEKELEFVLNKIPDYNINTIDEAIEVADIIVKKLKMKDSFGGVF